jgi:glycosyltransferase involved in cell wall biosynthesis
LKVSVVTACFNSAATIADTLRSVNAQTHADVEHIIVDGGSTDGTIALVAELGHRVVKVISEPDNGIYDAMNKGLAVATGDVVGLLNSDDFYATNDALASVAEALDAPEIDAVYADLCYVAKNDVDRIVRYWRSRPFRPGLFARGWAPPHPTLFVRRQFFETLGVFDLAHPIVADLDLMTRFLEVHHLRTRHLPQVLVHMRSGGASNLGIRNIVRQNVEIWRVLQRHGVARSALGFALGKLLSRGSQFLARPP